MAQPEVTLSAEWASQDAILLTWPHAASDWRYWLEQIDCTFALLAATISHQEKVLISCLDNAHGQHVLELLITANADLTRCQRYIAPSNDIWVRDDGPMTVYCNSQPVLLDFQFNGWAANTVTISTIK